MTKITKEHRDAVSEFIDIGPYTPHPKNTKEEILKSADKQYRQLVLVREYLIENLLDIAEDDDPRRPSFPFPRD